MPIRFRCSYCNRLLGIATRKAGTQTTCPHCGYEITVPIPEEDKATTERLNLDDVDELLGKSGTATVKDAVASAAPPAAAVAPPAPPEAQEPVEKTQPEATKPVTPKPTPAAKPRVAPPPIPKSAPKSNSPDERPLFEGDVDEILGAPAETEEAERPKPRATSGMDAMSLGEPPRQIVITPQKATLLMVLVVVLLLLSFAAGYFLAGKG
jgi:hypothetical protein